MISLLMWDVLAKHTSVRTVSIPRGAALHFSETIARDFENLGENLFANGYFPIFVGEPKRVVNTDGNIVASAKARRDMSDLWLADTGHGRDLISITNVIVKGGDKTA